MYSSLDDWGIFSFGLVHKLHGITKSHTILVNLHKYIFPPIYKNQLKDYQKG